MPSGVTYPLPFLPVNCQSFAHLCEVKLKQIKVWADQGYTGKRVEAVTNFYDGNPVQVNAQVTNADKQVWGELAAPPQGWIFSGLLRRAGENTASPLPVTVQPSLSGSSSRPLSPEMSPPSPNLIENSSSSDATHSDLKQRLIRELVNRETPPGGEPT